MLPSTRALLERAERRASQITDTDRANRYRGRCERVIVRHCARHGELLPTLYVKALEPERGGHPRHVLTTWPGNVIGALEVTGHARGFHGVKLTCYAITIEGRRYIGRGHGPGLYLNLRPSKRS